MLSLFVFALFAATCNAIPRTIVLTANGVASWTGAGLLGANPTFTVDVGDVLTFDAIWATGTHSFSLQTGNGTAPTGTLIVASPSTLTDANPEDVLVYTVPANMTGIQFWYIDTLNPTTMRGKVIVTGSICTTGTFRDINAGTCPYCNNCTAGQFISQPCTGASNVTGGNANCTACTACPSTQFATTPCTGTGLANANGCVNKNCFARGCGFGVACAERNATYFDCTCTGKAAVTVAASSTFSGCAGVDAPSAADIINGLNQELFEGSLKIAVPQISAAVITTRAAAAKSMTVSITHSASKVDDLLGAVRTHMANLVKYDYVANDFETNVITPGATAVVEITIDDGEEDPSEDEDSASLLAGSFALVFSVVFASLL